LLIKILEFIIATTITITGHFTKCNNAKCNSFFLVNPDQLPGELGYLCPVCTARMQTCHTVQCSTCGTVLNFIGASHDEEKVNFTVEKCSHCLGTVEDEWEIEPLYQSESYI
jgi:hypothetical protein